MDLLHPDRWRRRRFLLVVNRFELTDLPRAYALELVIMMLTPGFERRHFAHAFDWHKGMDVVVDQLVAYFRDEALPYIAENAASFTFEDGLRWVAGVVEMGRGLATPMPEPVQLALRQLRKDGATRADIARRFRVPVGVVDPWTSRAYGVKNLK